MSETNDVSEASGVSDANYGSRMLDDYLRATWRSGSPRDAMEQYQVAMLRQWISHLEFVLRDERLAPDVIRRIIKGLIYGCTPNAGETELREHLMAQHINHLQSCTTDPSWVSDLLRNKVRRSVKFPDFGVAGA